MVKESANKPKRKAPAKKRNASGTARTKRAGKKTAARKRTLPAWAFYILVGLMAALFFVGLFFFCIRPYAYRWKPCYGLKAYGVCLPYGFSVYGFDISHHQGDINWDELRKTQDAPYPVRFVFMKASEGGDFSDTTFLRNFDRARQTGFIRGAYHFFNPKTDPLRQAEFFIQSVRLEAGDLPPVLDVEKAGKNDDTLRHNVRVWLDRIERHYHVKPILYASYKFKTRYLNDSIFNTYPYWIAHYYADSVEYRGEWKFWQHTDAGRLPGIKEDVDLNVFNGSLEELERLTIK